MEYILCVIKTGFNYMIENPYISDLNKLLFNRTVLLIFIYVISVYYYFINNMNKSFIKDIAYKIK